MYNCTTGGINPFHWGEIGRYIVVVSCLKVIESSHCGRIFIETFDPRLLASHNNVVNASLSSSQINTPVLWHNVAVCGQVSCGESATCWKETRCICCLRPDSEYCMFWPWATVGLSVCRVDKYKHARLKNIEVNRATSLSRSD